MDFIFLSDRVSKANIVTLVVLLPWLPYYKIKAIKFYRKYLMCQNILYYWQYKQKQIVICFEAFNFYCGRSEDFTIVSWLDICSKQGSHFISLSNIYNFTFKKQRISSIFLFTHL